MTSPRFLTSVETQLALRFARIEGALIGALATMALCLAAATLPRGFMASLETSATSFMASLQTSAKSFGAPIPAAHSFAPAPGLSAPRR